MNHNNFDRVIKPWGVVRSDPFAKGVAGPNTFGDWASSQTPWGSC